VLAGAGTIVLFYVTRVVAGRVAQGLVYNIVSAVAVIAILVAVRLYRPARPLPWLLLAAAQSLYVVADFVYWYLNEIRQFAEFPTIADLFYLLQYPVLVAALAVFVARRTPGWHLAALIDATVIAIGFGLLGWVYVIAPMAEATDVTPFAKAVSIAYPIMDLFVLAILVRLVIGPGARPAAFYLLLVSSLAMLVADVIYAVQTESGTWQDGTWVDALWIIEYILLGAAALHPSMRWLDQRPGPPVGLIADIDIAPPGVSGWRLAGLAAASLIAPATLLIQYVRGGPTHVVVIALVSAAMVLLVLGRMAGLVAAQRRLAITDSLTGLYTRRFFQEEMRVEAARASRGDTGLGLLLLDVDEFKRINDTFGHPAGDRVLQELAARLHASCRPGDIIARYGGEEFAVLLSGAAPAVVTEIAERIRRGVASQPLCIEEGFVTVPVTVSVGAAMLPRDGVSEDAVVHAADRALYEAKRTGRNRVVTAWQSPRTITTHSRPR